MKNKILTLIQTQFSPVTGKLIIAMVLGYKTTRDHEWFAMQDNMQKWGIVHYLARSGLHVTLILILLFTILSLCPMSLNIKRIVAMILLLIFSLLTWMSVSFQRALATFFLSIGAQFFYLPVRTIQLLCINALLICSLNPWHVFFLDFQLSFLMTGIIVLFFEQQNSTIIESSRTGFVR